MKALPIVARELRVASRRSRTYARRWVVALAAVLFGGWFVWTFSSLRILGVGQTQIFQNLAQTIFVLCLFAGITTADCLSEEKREGTLGLLFLTDLKSYDIVLGKLAATSLNAFYALLGLIPMLSLAVLLGGVTIGDVAGVSLVLANTMFLSLSLGMLISAM